MLLSIKRLISAAILLTVSAALAEAPIPGSDVPAKEIASSTPPDAPKLDEQVRILTREVQALENDVHELKTTVQVHEADTVHYLDQTDHPLWP